MAAETDAFQTLRAALGAPFLTGHSGCEGGPFVKLRYETTGDAVRAYDALGAALANNVPMPVPPEANSEHERLYQERQAASLASMSPEDREASSLPDAILFIERWMPDAMPANAAGQISFGRSLLEMALDAMKTRVAADEAGAR